MSAGPWFVEGCTTWGGRNFWVIWKRDPSLYGGRRYLPTASRTDRKRFYDEVKAEAAAARLNDRAATHHSAESAGDKNA